ncbi:hypothetical protein AMECASPLE_022289 [Ameca splendens]|uniref:Uncharacterized protein n=1 Tax=Ameca splendens TaxID=208324 RepID=A0ABV0XGS7_9TELE
MFRLRTIVKAVFLFKFECKNNNLLLINGGRCFYSAFTLKLLIIDLFVQQMTFGAQRSSRSFSTFQALSHVSSTLWKVDELRFSFSPYQGSGLVLIKFFILFPHLCCPYLTLYHKNIDCLRP